jgi:radical SAM protein with 4Fe4S-binding SPASM domain
MMKNIIPIVPVRNAPDYTRLPVFGKPDHRHMELIIKPTEACNFKCTFCSSTDITDEKSKVLDLESIYAFLQRFPGTQTIIVNGGDPLMVKPQYYWEIIKYIEDHDLQTSLSFTTNLWAFYKKPEMWEELFRHPRMGVTTSFNYGTTRRITETEVFTEEIFRKVSDKFLERIGYRPDFISVITDENEDTAIDNVKLAQEMDVECKLNYAMSSGVQSAPYQLSKIYRTYTEIYEQGLWPWEFNTKQMMQRLDGKATSCPQHRACDEGIRCLQPSGDYYSCGSFGDDRQYPINFKQEVLEGKFFKPLQTAPELTMLKEECLTCPMFNICNGCRKTVNDMKNHGVVETHCKLMKTIAGKIISINDEASTITIDRMPKLGFRKYESQSVTDGVAQQAR